MRTAVLTRSRAETAAIVFGFSILMGLLAHVAVPLPFTPVPVTGQTFGVMLAGIVLGTRSARSGPPAAAAAMLLYLAQGVMGFPVFSPTGPGGLAQLLGPTGGFLLSYPFAAYAIGVISRGAHQRQTRRVTRGVRGRLLAALLCGEAIIFFCGAVWLGALLRLPPGAVLAAAVWPFLPGEMLKVALVFVVAQVIGAGGPAERNAPGGGDARGGAQ